MKKEFKLYLIIAFLIGIVTSQFCFALKVPDIILPDTIDADLREKIDYIIDIVNKGRYVMTVVGTAVSTSDTLDAGEFVLDDSGVTKKFVISNGTDNYYVDLTSL